MTSRNQFDQAGREEHMPLDYDSLTKEELIRRLEEATRPPSLGLYWERNRIEHDRALNDDFVALELDPELSCGAAPFENLIIEGDNFDALRLLRLTHAGKIKCIYIDPPYNTGRRDFVYNDRYVDPEDAYRHSTWLEFMYRRLLLARELLSEDGALFVSIDDNEVFHLGLLLNKVFGERNHIATVIWQKVYAPKNTALHFSDDHEYILVYAADRDEWRPNPLPRSEKQVKASRASGCRWVWAISSTVSASGCRSTNPLKQEYDRLGNPIADDPERLKRALNKILVLHPDIIRLASSRCYAEFSEAYETQPLPDELTFDTPPIPSDRNSYGIRPPGLNSHELEFVELLDHDPGDTVSWWHRNEPQKPDSVALVMPSGRRYFPDFIVSVQGRQPGDGLILIEVKGPHLLNTDDTKDKLLAQHKTYRNLLMVTRESGGAWMTVAYQERNNKVVLDRRFDVDLLATHVASVR